MDKKVLITIAVIILYGCSPAHLRSHAILNKSLMMNGAYANHFDGGGNHYCHCVFLYDSGVYCDINAITNCDINFIKQGIVSHDYNNIATWGIFSIDQNNIKIEKWAAEPFAPIFIRSGKILNDSTFVITKIREKNGWRKSEVQDTFLFTHCDIKPDSITKYIK